MHTTVNKCVVSKPEWGRVLETAPNLDQLSELIPMVIKYCKIISNHGSTIFFEKKENNHLENCQVFAGYFMKPDNSLRFLKYTEFVTL
jgi:hypothetical protein